ncbi:neutral amino acid [Botrytis cinerea]
MAMNPQSPVMSSGNNSNNDVNDKSRAEYISEDQTPTTEYKKVSWRSTWDADASSLSGDSGKDLLSQQIEAEAGSAIKYRSCSWQKTAALLFSEYICLAIMSFPWSYSVLGLVPGLILTAVVAFLVLYTSLVLWEFCMRHPELRDGLHVLTTAKYLNTITNHSQCTVIFAVVAAVICWVCSVPRTFSALSWLATLSAIFTFISVMLATIFAGIEPHPLGYNPDPNSIIAATGLHGGAPTVTAVMLKGTTFVNGFNAFLNISYTFIGQITIPSFMAEMKNPADFPKALWAVTIAEIIVFSLVGSIIYAFTGNQYMSAPAFGSLGKKLYVDISFSFMIPTLIFLGVLYASVSGRFIINRVFHNNKRHLHENTTKGWVVWIAILAATWIGAFIIAEVIPFFSDLLSLMSSLFDSFFGFIFWGAAYIRMRRVDHGAGWISKTSKVGLGFNILIILIGLLFLTAGTYTSVQSIVDGYNAGTFGGAFTCASNGI